MVSKLRYHVFLSFFLCNIILINSSYSQTAEKTDLQQILNKSLNLENKKNEVEADVGIDWLGSIPVLSPWETEFNTSVESLWSKASNQAETIEYQAFNLNSTINQRTPYGLSLGLDYEQLLNVPELQGNFLIKERISANIFLSLYNDFLGASTSKILAATEKKNQSLIADKILLQTCERIANQFFETYLNEQNYAINLDAIKDIEFIQKRINRNAVTAQDYLSLTIDKAQLDSRLVKSAQQYNTSQLALSDLTRIPMTEVHDLTLSENIDVLTKKLEKRFQIIERLDLEVELLEARKRLLDINQRNDVSLYAGLRSQQTTAFSDTNASNVMGINFRWNFGNIQIENSKRSIDLEILKRKVQKEHILSQQAKIKESFRLAMDGQASTVNVMAKATQNADKLQDIARKNFLNGRIGFFEFLTLRNQVNSVKTEFIQALIDFYKIYLDQSVYLGDAESACFLATSPMREAQTKL